MSNIEQMARAIVEREGGYVDHPNDPGGATKYGVTIHTMRALGIDLDRDGDIDSEDVKLLTIDKAVEIFIRNYFRRPKIDQLPECLHDTVFDMQVNAGNNAIKILQRMLRRLGANISVDGALGPKSIGAAHAAVQKHGGDEIWAAYGIERRNYYFTIADRRPKLRVFARSRSGGKGGWITRSEHFIPKKYHMTKAQFERRVSSWG